MTDDSVWDFGYDTESQLVSADDGSTSAAYIYDPMHRQAQKEVNSTKTRYIHAGIRIIAEYDGSGNFVKRYVYGPDLDEVLLEIDGSNDVTYLHHDRLGSIIATTDDTGTIINSYAYSPWGESGSMSGTTFGFTGQRYDAETGLYFYKNRHYSPEIGRFLQPDPTGYKDGLNMYQYANNNPNKFTDPLGLAASDGSLKESDTGGTILVENGLYSFIYYPGLNLWVTAFATHIGNPWGPATGIGWYGFGSATAFDAAFTGGASTPSQNNASESGESGAPLGCVQDALFLIRQAYDRLKGTNQGTVDHTQSGCGTAPVVAIYHPSWAIEAGTPVRGRADYSDRGWYREFDPPTTPNPKPKGRPETFPPPPPEIVRPRLA